MARNVKTTKSFRNDLKKYSNDTDVKSILGDVVESLQNDKELDPKYRNHKLKNQKKKEVHFDCHIKPNVVLLYTYGNDGSLILERIGTHNRLELTERLILSIKEDTACVASKTAYGDTGLDDNGIYYFGKKPKKPVNWKDIKKDDVRKYRMNEMVKNGIFIPRCPKRALSRKSSVGMPYITLRSPDSNVGTDVTILGSKNEAKQFIVDHLYNKQFPMAASEMTIQTYNEHPEYYEDDMEEFYYNMSWLDDNEGEALFVESDGKAHVFDGMYADAIEALKLRNITELIYSDAYEYIVYNAYIVYDDSIEGWRDSVDATDYLDGSFDDYKWKNIKGTYIQIPDWADSWRDVIM